MASRSCTCRIYGVDGALFRLPDAHAFRGCSPITEDFIQDCARRWKIPVRTSNRERWNGPASVPNNYGSRDADAATSKLSTGSDVGRLAAADRRHGTD